MKSLLFIKIYLVLEAVMLLSENDELLVSERKAYLRRASPVSSSLESEYLMLHLWKNVNCHIGGKKRNWEVLLVLLLVKLSTTSEMSGDSGRKK